ncbi:MAG: two component system response regulator, modulated diguanylate cyclase [Candidatus Aminicenantes bacterium]|nr:two component system response regulator, modulated diguanylate cyclase [Candidatus Aminicenantes bacterium]
MNQDQKPDRNIKVLVVEDEAKNMKLIRDLLSFSGYAVIEASNGQAGIEAARQEKPDLILMDVQMPVMDGLEATKELKSNEATKKVPVIALTAYAMKEDRQRFFSVGFDGYIPKPIDTRAFLETIKAFLSQEPPARNQVMADDRKSHRWKVLLVDDDPKSLRFYEAILGDKNYDLIKAATGKEAIELTTSHIPDLILLDIILPDIDGMEVTRRIRKDEAAKNIPIILITSLDDSETKEIGLESGAEEFLTKPVRPVELAARVNSMIRLKQYRDQIAVRRQSLEVEAKGTGPAEPNAEPEAKPPLLLLVEDNPSDIQFVVDTLKDLPCRIEVVKTGNEVLPRVLKGDIDLILLDILLPDIDGFEICRRLKASENARDVQVVIITCLADLDSKIRGIEMGAEEFLVKPLIPRELTARVRVLLEKKGHIDQLRSHLETAMDTAKMDWLTGLNNHGSFYVFLTHELKRASRQRYPVSLILIDIDDFKLYNDTLGHTVGDAYLKELAQLISCQIRDVDMAARYGGEEFAIVVPYAGLAVGKKVAKRIHEAIRSHKFAAAPEERFQTLTVSLGLAVYPTDAWKIEDLIEQADQMLYKAKENGKNQLCVKSDAGQVEAVR